MRAFCADRDRALASGAGVPTADARPGRLGPRKPKVVPDAAHIGTRNITSGPDDYARVIRLLVIVRDELELAGRSPGDLVTITRQANDALINDLAIVARLIRKMAERL